jgi:hypothetical protein
MPLRPFIDVPDNLRDWTRWMEDQAIIADSNSVTTAMIQDEAVTYAKIQDVAADRILGRLSTAGVATELTAAQVATLLGAATGTQQANITDASVAHALNATFSDTEVEAALDALGAKINLILDALDAYGMTA